MLFIEEKNILISKSVILQVYPKFHEILLSFFNNKYIDIMDINEFKWFYYKYLECMDYNVIRLIISKHLMEDD